ncbi:MAG: hypothetical protein R2759_04875 [Bacteroidales bacterium]
MNFTFLQNTGKSFISSGLAVLFLFISLGNAMGQKKKGDAEEGNDTIKSGDVSGLKWRSIGPAFTSGRIADFAVNPKTIQSIMWQQLVAMFGKPKITVPLSVPYSIIRGLFPLAAWPWIPITQM